MGAARPIPLSPSALAGPFTRRQRGMTSVAMEYHGAITEPLTGQTWARFAGQRGLLWPWWRERRYCSVGVDASTARGRRVIRVEHILTSQLNGGRRQR